MATYYSPWTVAARCLRGVSSSSTVARERKTRCHIRRFIGPLCCRLIPLRAVLFARLLHLLPLKINSLAVPCAPLAISARALVTLSPPHPSFTHTRSLPLSLSPSLALFLSLFLFVLLSLPLSFSLAFSLAFSSLALSLVLARPSRLVNAIDTLIRTFRPLSRTFSRTSRALHDRPTARFSRIKEVALCRHSPPLVAAATTIASTTTTATSIATALDGDGED